MTKKVRIENADTSNYKVVVQVWDKGPLLCTDPDGNPNYGPDTLAFERNLDFPTAMADDIYLTSTRYFVVKEA